MTIENVFEWLEQAATGGLDVITSLSNGVSNLFFNTQGDGVVELNVIGVLAIAAVGAPLAWKFIKYLISLFNKVRPN